MAARHTLLTFALIAGGVLHAQTPSRYDPALFQNRIATDQLTFLNAFAGTPSKNLLHDKQFHKLLKIMVPGCTFHYGTDMPLESALDLVLKDTPLPVQIRDGRYLSLSGRSGPYLAGRGLLWIDLHEGIALGAFYFHPTNGEPTPSVTVFSKQVREESVSLGELPPAFAQDLTQWTIDSRIPPLTVRYFLSALNRKGIVEHDEDFCAGPASPSSCAQMNAKAVDIDLDAAYYLDQTHHATNATAWMINGPDQAAWLRIRETTCGGVADPLRCRIVVTRERIHAALARGPGLHPISPMTGR